MIGWSFGGSPCFTVAAQEPDRVRGIATVASQRADTEGVSKLSPRPLLLLHGTDDTCVSQACSEGLYRAYGGTGSRELRLFGGDDHGLTKNAVEVETLIFTFAARCFGREKQLDKQTVEQASQDLAGGQQERVAEMKASHDLEGEQL
jgi:dienelactone hydrolase